MVLSNVIQSKVKPKPIVTTRFPALRSSAAYMCLLQLGLFIGLCMSGFPNELPTALFKSRRENEMIELL